MLGRVKDWARWMRVVVVRNKIKKKELDIKNVGNRVLVVAPHPDDEVLGCAGLVQRMLNIGRQVDVVILSGGGRSHAGCCCIGEEVLVARRRELSQSAARIMGLPPDQLHFLDYPDGGINYDCGETVKLQQLIATLSPTAIFVPHRGEGWSDHIAAGNIVRKLISSMSAVQLYEYCVWFWYYNAKVADWQQARVLNMTVEEHKTKLAAIGAYISPLAPCGNPWSGVLPRVFVNANRWKKELYFKSR